MKAKMMVAALFLMTGLSVKAFATVHDDGGEEYLLVEAWMKTPFDAGSAEEAIVVESWMTAPFNAGTGEEAIVLESWMTRPFRTDQAGEDHSTGTMIPGTGS